MRDLPNHVEAQGGRLLRVLLVRHGQLSIEASRLLPLDGQLIRYPSARRTAPMSGLAPGEKVKLRLADLWMHTKASRVLQLKCRPPLLPALSASLWKSAAVRTAAVTALLNEGLDAFARKRRRRKKAR
jgi:hypothetical protein